MPRLTLRVGITGKRAIPAGLRDAIRAAIDDVFDALARFLVQSQARHRGVWADAPPLLRIVSGLAEGADQISAQVALARRERAFTEGKAEVRIAAILPFPRAQYVEDFRNDPNTGTERTAAAFADITSQFQQLLREASQEAVLEIDDEASHQDHAFGYAALRDTLLDHSDVLIAVSDDKDGGTGGTVDVMRIAMREQVPVIKIATVSGEAHLMQAPDPDAVDQTPTESDAIAPDRPLPAALERALKLSLEPPSAPSHEPHHGPRSGRKQLEQYLEEDFQPAWFGRLFRAFRDALTVPQPGAWPAGLSAFVNALCSYRLETPAEKVAALSASSALSSSVPRDGSGKFARVHITRQAWADALSIRYADATRSSYVAIAFLGAMAVLVGLLALFPQGETAAVLTKITALIIEGAILIIVGIFFFGPAHHGRWHERVVEYRALAELLRHQRFVYTLGASDRLERTADRTWREPDAWVGWYVRATMRELGFPGVVLSADYRRRIMELFRREEVEAQRAYNNAVAARFTTIDERLGRLVEWAWRATIYLAIGGALLLGALFLFEHNHWPGHAGAEELLHIAKPALTLLMAFIPACVAAIHGIRFQMEFRNTAERAATTERELGQIAQKLEGMGPAPGRRYSLFYVRAANAAMSADLAGWSNVYRGKSPEPP